MVDGSEDEFAELHASSHSEIEDASMGSSSGAAAVTFDDLKPSSIQGAKAEQPTESKPPFSTTESSSSTKTIKNPTASLTPRQISTHNVTPSPYVVDLSSPSTTNSNPKTPLKSPGGMDGSWSTAATPGVDSPNVFPGLVGGSKPALHGLNPASIALFNAKIASGRGGGDSPLSPGPSPKPRSGLGTSVFTASNLPAPNSSRKQGDEEGMSTDEEDGWSVAGNDPFSRQNSMMPLSSAPSFNASHAPGLTVTSSLGVLQEEGKLLYLLHLIITITNFPVSPQSTPQKSKNIENLTSRITSSVTPSALAAPLPPSASNTAPSSPEARPNSVTFAASHPLPPTLPPPSHSPSSIKSESRALSTEESPNKGYKFTSSIVGDSTSDGEVSYNVRRRANSASTGHVANDTSKLTAGEKTGSHARSSSVNTASVPIHAAAVSANGGKPSSASSPDDDWERASLSRLARLPDSVSGSDMDSLSGRLRDLGSPDSESVTPTNPGTGRGNESATSSSDFKSRRNTIKANAPPNERLSGSDFGFHLPGVPSAPPSGDWNNGSGKGGDSDFGGEGDMMNRLPSAPAVPPNIQDKLPHVAIFHKPATPKEELHVNPHFPSALPNEPPTTNGLESPSTPRTQTHSRTPTTSSGQHAPFTAPPPPPLGYEPSPTSATSSLNAGHSVQRGYTPPNSVVSPHHNFATSMPPQFTLAHPSHLYAPAASTNVPQASPYAYGTNGHMNGTNDAYRLPVQVRPPPTELDPETIGKAQKHTKFALSALNFEDLETARNELKKALLLLS